jgi:type IV secretory pathway protease TraF
VRPQRIRRWTRSNTLVALLVASSLLSLPWVRVNVEPSVPYGPYRLRAVPAEVTRGTLVLLPVPASMAQWHARWVPLLKPVAAVAGDEVCQLEHALFVRGTFYGLVHTEVAGQALPQYVENETCAIIEEGEVFLASPVRRSLDSRYFGPVPVATLTHQATPLLTWR